jgi:hypothetical protein
MVNGRPRDEVQSDIAAGRPAIAADVDALAAKCAALLDLKRSERFWNSIEYRIRISPAFLNWLARPTTYLEDLDPAATKRIRRHVALTYERARSAAIRRVGKREDGCGPDAGGGRGCPRMRLSRADVVSGGVSHGMITLPL